MLRFFIRIARAAILLFPAAVFAQSRTIGQQQAISLLQQNAAALGLRYQPDQMLVRDAYTTADGLQMVYLDQAFQGVPIRNIMLVLAFRQGKLVSKSGSFLPQVPERNSGKLAAPAIGADVAAKAAIRSKAGMVASILPSAAPKLERGWYRLGRMGASKTDVHAQLVWIPSKKDSSLSLHWAVEHAPLQQPKAWVSFVDAQTGLVTSEESSTLECFTEQERNDGDAGEAMADAPITAENPAPYFALNDEATYRVIAYPAGNRFLPNGAPKLVSNPWQILPEGNPATTVKWHSNGISTWPSTQGNNVYANDGSVNDPFSGKLAPSQSANALLFDYADDTTVTPRQSSPVPNKQAAVTNLFYWNNVCHDISYQYGFDEVAGNFQFNNLGRGGAEVDRVNALAQDISATNNAFFSTARDGIAGVMEMGLFTSPLYPLPIDGSFDNQVIVHEYGHGISNRFTGGPNNASCLRNDEQMGEGWSDYLGLMFTQDWANSNLNTGYTSAIGLGSASLNRVANGPGFRTQRYSTNYGINNRSYGATIGNAISPHLHGEIWCALLWDMTWNIIQQTGTINPNLYNATAPGGNSIALKLVMEGMRLQPCSPGFVDGRNAILKADTLLYGGQYSATIWETFRRRGLGPLASQGSSDDSNDQVADFGAGPRFQFVQSGRSATEKTVATEGPCRSFFRDTIYFTVSGPTAQPTMVSFFQAGGTASQGNDFDFSTSPDFANPQTSLVFPAGSTTPVPIYLRIYDDGNDETDEWFQLAFGLSGPTDALEGGPVNQNFRYNIFDNDDNPEDVFNLSFTKGIETALSLAQQRVEPRARQLVTGNNGKMMLTLENLMPIDYGCTPMRIDRAGTGMVLFTDAGKENGLMSKTMTILPAAANANGRYKVSMLFTTAEIAGWEAATGRRFSEIELIRTDSAIGKTTPANPTGAGAIQVVTKPTITVLSGGRQVLGEFTGGFGGFGAGVYTPTINFVDSTLLVNETTEASSGCLDFRTINIPFTVTRPLSAATKLRLYAAAGTTLIPGTDFVYSAINNFAQPTDTLSLPAGFSGTGQVYLRIFNDRFWERGLQLKLAIEKLDSAGTIKLGLQPTTTITLLDFDFDPNGGDTTVTYFGKIPVPYQGVNWNPFTNIRTGRHQYLITAAELQAAGMVPNLGISALSFVVQNKQTVGAFTNFKVAIKQGTETDLDTGPVTTGFTEVFSGSYTTTLGENRINFQTPLVWDGTSNLVVQVCRNYDVASTLSDFIMVDDAPALGTAKATYTAYSFSAGVACDVTLNKTTSANRPVLRFYQVSAPVLVASGAGGNAVGNEALNNKSTTYYFNSNGRLIAAIKNLTKHNYGCTQVSIDRAGTSGVGFLTSATTGDLFSKTILVTPTTDTAEGDFEVTMYLLPEEVTGWQTRTGRSAAQLYMVHTDSAIRRVTPDNNTGGGQVRIQVSTDRFSGTDRLAITGRFQGKLRGGFGVGLPYTTVYTFTGNGNWTDAANWLGGLVPPATLLKHTAILINPSGTCVLNTAQQVQAGAGLHVVPGKPFVVNGLLQMQ